MIVSAHARASTETIQKSATCKNCFISRYLTHSSFRHSFCRTNLEENARQPNYLWYSGSILAAFSSDSNSKGNSHTSWVYFVRFLIVFSYGITTRSLDVIKTQFLCKLFATICAHIDSKLLKTTVYHLQRKDLTSTFNIKIAMDLRR